MRYAPLEDPSMSRGVALSTALAKELPVPLLTLSQKACFAQLTNAALEHGLQRINLPLSLLKVHTTNVTALCVCTAIASSDPQSESLLCTAD